jgi:hypothetical protein
MATGLLSTAYQLHKASQSGLVLLALFRFTRPAYLDDDVALNFSVIFHIDTPVMATARAAVIPTRFPNITANASFNIFMVTFSCNILAFPFSSHAACCPVAASGT